ncbi:MAG: hypothetical protein KA354_19705 [Phycisphaerae bacterium]|nr:hypothetical protein [Phycisphaerae bacterium]
MARGKTGTQKRRGVPSRQERLERLRQRIGEKGVKAANQLVKEQDADVIRYAYLTLPRPAAAGGLGTRIEALLARLDADKAAEIRATLVAVKATE